VICDRWARLVLQLRFSLHVSKNAAVCILKCRIPAPVLIGPLLAGWYRVARRRGRHPCRMTRGVCAQHIFILLGGYNDCMRVWVHLREWLRLLHWHWFQSLPLVPRNPRQVRRICQSSGFALNFSCHLSSCALSKHSKSQKTRTLNIRRSEVATLILFLMQHTCSGTGAALTVDIARNTRAAKVSCLNIDSCISIPV
jgi:hypothetical protein